MDKLTLPAFPDVKLHSGFHASGLLGQGMDDLGRGRCEWPRFGSVRAIGAVDTQHMLSSQRWSMKLVN
jgi:hypothetical protein